MSDCLPPAACRLPEADNAKRLKGAIDSRIAEEQARQKALQSSPSRSNSTVRRSSSRTVSPSKRQARTRDRSGKDIDAEKGPDPSEFDRAFVVDDEESSSRVGTPGPGAERSGSAMIEGAGNDKAPVEDNKESNGKVVEDGDAPAPPELPTDVRVKLRKLDKLESRYQGDYRLSLTNVTIFN